MKTGRDIAEIATQIITEAKSKRDFVADTRKLRLENDGVLLVDGIGRYSPTRHFIDQVAGRTGIPAKYAERMRVESPQLLATNVNHWFQRSPESRMVRTLSNGTKVARAFLSKIYRPLDNHDLAATLLPKLQEAGCEVKSAELTERRLYIQAVTARITGEVKKGDVVQAGVVISNSEIGCGSIKIEPMIYRLVCLNGLIQGNALRKHHVGRAFEGGDSEESFEVFSDETRRLDDRAFWAKACDVVDAAIDQIRFARTVEEFAAKATGTIGNPVDVVEVAQKRFDLSEGEGKSVLEHLASGGDLSLWGLANAVTRTAQDVNSYDRAIELERLGGVVMELKPQDFSKN